MPFVTGCLVRIESVKKIIGGWERGGLGTPPSSDELRLSELMGRA